MGGQQERDRRSHSIRPVEGTEVAKVVRKRRGSVFESREVFGHEGVSVLMKPNSTTDIPVAAVDELLPIAIQLKQEDALLKTHEDAREALRTKVMPIFKQYEDWVGVESSGDDVRLTDVEREENIVYDAMLLRASMSREKHRKVVRRERVIVEFSLARGLSPEVAVYEAGQMLRSLGRYARNSGRVTIKPEVDEEVLAQEVNAGRISLEPGARKSTKKDYVTATPYLKNPPKKGEPASS
ncbi:MAG: hypothetical protein M1405_01650 [Patescibacteria group bacterium]|nr:hypothetical protein [Patescibacteria group bacterium]